METFRVKVGAKGEIVLPRDGKEGNEITRNDNK